MDTLRHARIEALAAQNRYVQSRAPAADQLSRLLQIPVAPDDAVSYGEAVAAQDASQRHQQFHLIWHRVWGVRLRAEVLESTKRLADLFESESAVLFWGRSSPIGFPVPVSTALRHLPEHVGPESQMAGPSNIADMLLVSADRKSGLSLAYNHFAMADQYDLRSWGRYARSVAH